MMNPAMHEALRKVEQRFDELTSMLGNPEITSDLCYRTCRRSDQAHRPVGTLAGTSAVHSRGPHPAGHHQAKPHGTGPPWKRER